MLLDENGIFGGILTVQKTKIVDEILNTDEVECECNKLEEI